MSVRVRFALIGFIAVLIGVGSGTQFDPEVCHASEAIFDEIVKVKEQFTD